MHTSDQSPGARPARRPLFSGRGGKLVASALAIALAFTLTPATASWAEEPEAPAADTSVASETVTEQEPSGEGASDAPADTDETSAPPAQDPPAITPFAAGDGSLSLTVSQQTGTEPFQDNDDPGNDSGPDNDIVRTNDTIAYNLGIRYEGEDQTKPTIAFELPRGQELVQLPPFCLAGSGADPETLPAPASPLTATSWESLPRQTVTCLLKDVNMGTALNYAFVAQVRSEVPHGTQMDELVFEVTSDQVTDPATISPEPVTVSAAAKYDLSKNNNASSENSGPLFQSQGACPAPYSDEACYKIAYPVTITVPAGGKGTTPLEGPITFIDNLDPESFYGSTTWGQMVAVAGSDAAAKAQYGPQIGGCSYIGNGSGFRGSLPYSRFSLGTYANETNSVRESGVLDCPTGARGEPSTLTITGADTTAFSTPTTTGGGNALPSNTGYVVTFEISVNVPVEAITEFGQTPGQSAMTLSTFNEFTDFTATTLDGQTVTDENPENNARRATTRIQLDGSIDKRFTGIPGAEGNTPAGEFWPGGTTNMPGPPGSGIVKDGNTVVMEGQALYSVLTTRSLGAAGSDTSQTLVACDIWEQDRLALASHPDWNGGYAAAYPGNNRPVFPVLVRHPYYNVPASAIGTDASGIGSYKVEYSSGPAGAGADSDCSSGTWSEDPNDIVAPTTDAHGRTVWDGVNRVRVTWVSEFPQGTTFGETVFNLAIGLVVLDGDKADPIGNWASQVRSQGTKSTAEVFADADAVKQVPTYDPETHRGDIGDRVWQGDALVRVRKFVENPSTGEFTDAAVPQYTSGGTVRYRLNPSLTGDVTAAGRTYPVTMEDCLPQFQVFESAEQGGSALNPVVQQMGAPAGAEIECPANRQYLKWDLGERAVGAPIDPVVVTAEVLDVARNGTFTNDVTIASPADSSPVGGRSDDVQMQLVVPTGIKISKTVNKPVIEVNQDWVTQPRTLTWTVQFANIDAPSNVENVDVIDVLPANGLHGNDFDGTLVFDSATPTAGDDIVILYTGAPAASLESDPSDPSNAADGATVWCDAVSGSVISGDGAAVDCPQTNEEVTGLRFQRAGAFTPDHDFAVAINMTPVGNTAGDVYRNITSGRVDGVSQGVGPAARVVNVVSSSVGDRVWDDLNDNGIQDDGEPGIPDVPVRLLGTDVDGNTVDLSTTTDADGTYLFEGLASGSYRVIFDASGLTGYTFTEKNAGDDTGVDSNADPATGESDEFELAADTDDLSIDAGLVQHTGGLVITKLLEGAGVEEFAASDELTFNVVCTVDGETVFEQDVTLQVNGQSSVTSDVLEPIPAGAECTVTETAAGNADPDALPEPVVVTIPWNPSTGESGTVTASLTNYYSAGTIEVSKALAGDDIAVEAAQDRMFEILVTCQVEEENGAGETVRSDVYSGVVKIKGGQTKVLVGDNDEPRLLPLGARCFGEETVTGGAAKSEIDFDSWENSVAVTSGTPEDLQALTISAVNTFENAELTVSKKVEGTGTGGAYDFTLACTIPGEGENGETVDGNYVLPESDAAFSLKDGQSRTITVPAGVTCQVAETNVPDGAKVTIVDSDDTTAGGDSDGIVANLTGGKNAVQVTNTFTTPPPGSGLAITGGQFLGGAGLLGAGLLLVGGALFLLRKRRNENTAAADPAQG